MARLQLSTGSTGIFSHPCGKLILVFAVLPEISHIVPPFLYFLRRPAAFPPRGSPHVVTAVWISPDFKSGRPRRRSQHRGATGVRTVSSLRSDRARPIAGAGLW